MEASSTVTGSVGREPEDKERHGDAVVEVGCDRPAALDLARAHDSQRVAVDAGRDAVRGEAGGRRSQPVALLHLELGKALHHGRAVGESGHGGEDRVLVDHRRGAGRGHPHALEPRASRADVGDRLAAFLA